MCLITIAPMGASGLDWGTLEYSHKRNDDGFGFAWYSANLEEWVPARSMGNIDELKQMIAEIPQDAPLIIHQRMATHGEKTLYNAHPFDAGEALLFHNGTIQDTGAAYKWFMGEFDQKGEKVFVDRPWSDTNAYNELEFTPLVEAAGTEFLRSESAMKMLSARVGSGSVLAIAIQGDPKPLIINEKRGDWERGIYYSNSYSRPGKYSYGNMGGYGSSHSNSFSGEKPWWKDDDKDDDKAKPEETAAKTADEPEAMAPPETGDKPWADMSQEERELWEKYLNYEYPDLKISAAYKNVDYDACIAWAQYDYEFGFGDDEPEAAPVKTGDTKRFDDMTDDEYYELTYGFTPSKYAL